MCACALISIGIQQLRAAGTSILMSEPFYKRLSPDAVAGCRKVDVIKRRESDPVTSLYTYDIDLGADFGIPNSTVKSKNLSQRSSRQLSTSNAHSGPNNRECESAGRKARRRPSVLVVSFDERNILLITRVYSPVFLFQIRTQ